MVTALGQHLNGDIVRDAVAIDQGAQEVVLGLGRCRESDFDLFETDLYEQFEEFDLLLQAHRDDQGLVSITKVNAAPYRSLFDFLIWPGTLREINYRYSFISLII